MRGSIDMGIRDRVAVFIMTMDGRVFNAFI